MLGTVYRPGPALPTVPPSSGSHDENMCSPLRVVEAVHLTLALLVEQSMLSFSLMAEKYVSLCFLFSFVLLDRLICNFFISYFFRSGRLFFDVIIHFANYRCTVTKITRTRLNLVCEALSAICSTLISPFLVSFILRRRTLSDTDAFRPSTGPTSKNRAVFSRHYCTRILFRHIEVRFDLN